MTDDEIKFKEVIDILKSLPDVNAPENFKTELMHRINAGNFEKKQRLWGKIFQPSKFIPSAALAVTTVIILFVMNIEPGEVDNPLLVEPRIREDANEMNNDYEINLIEQTLQKEIEKEQMEKYQEQTLERNYPLSKSTEGERVFPSEPETEEQNNTLSSERVEKKDDNTNLEKLKEVSSLNGILFQDTVQAKSIIYKKGLNFRQVNLNKEEKSEVIRLKEKIKALGNPALQLKSDK